MDKIRQKAQYLLEKLHEKYGVQSRHHIHLLVATVGRKEGEDQLQQDHWYLVDAHGQKFRLPKTMLFLGREECDVVLASQSVDKRHAVLTFDLYLNRFKVKDLSTTNGTFVNNSRIPEQEYVPLNHMDSIRLGHDAMMYHIEQGSQITNQGGQLPDPQYIPSWATRLPQEASTIHVHAHAMAECQGCIAEQNIEHTCSLKPESKGMEDATSTESHSQHHPQHDHQHQHQPHHDHPHHDQPHHNHPHHDQPHHQKHEHHSDKQPQDHSGLADHDIPQQHSPATGHPADQSSDGHLEKAVPDIPEDLASTPLGRNTWPRKKVRQVAHVGSVFNQESPDKCEATEARPAGALAPMYFVSFDDSVCNGSSSPVDSHRKLKNSRNPSELATVKKGTPLYGQPDWWGEGSDHDKTSQHKGDRRSETKCSRPSSLGLNSEEASVNTVKSASKLSTMDTVKYAGPTYMEIPIKDEDTAQGVKDIQTPPKSVTSSLSRDSLSNSPDVKQLSLAKSAKEQSPSIELNPSTSFTIDLDDLDHPPKKALNIGSSLSEFVPSKIRKNFRERKTQSSKAGSKESTPSKNSEERELSPLHQQKLDEIHSQVVEKKGKSSRLSSVHATVGSSLRSPNLEEIDRLSEFSDERRSIERDGAKKPVPTRSPQISKMTKVKPSPLTSGPKSSGPHTSGTHTSVSAAHTSPSAAHTSASAASYLFDKMFETGSNASAQSDKEMSPEQAMYREAAGHDLLTSRHSGEKVIRPVIDSSATKHVSPGAKPARADKAVKQVLKAVSKEEDEFIDEDDLLITEDNLDDEDKVGLVVKDDKEDKASEAGTYTIEADVKEGEEEEQAARMRIDQVFGVDVDDFTSDKPLINPLRLASPGGYDNVYEDYGNNIEGDKTPLDESGSFPIDDDLTLDEDYDDEEDESMENSDMTGPDASDGVQVWVKQLTALTSHKAPTDGGKMVRDEGDSPVSKKPPQGLSRKRPGTGRKLPSIPTDKSPESSEHSSYMGDQDLSLGEELQTKLTAPVTNGKPTRISSQTRSRGKNGTNGYADEPAASPRVSARSRGSVDTELLLQDTETVMAAMEARIGFKNSRNTKDSLSTESDTDASSTVALVNGDDDYVKPTIYKSPRDALAKKQQNDLSLKNNNAHSTPPSAPSKRPAVKSYQQTAVRSRSMASPRSITTVSSASKKSVVSDVFSSRRDSFDNDSVISDVSSDTGDGSLSRSSSKGKGTITMTKPNRAFQLRRARADSFDEPTTPRSAKSSASSKSVVSGSSVRSSSVHSTPRTRSMIETNRSEATSLGLQIVRKSRSNNTPEKVIKASSNTNIARAEPAKSSLKMQRASSLTIGPATPVLTTVKREPTPKTHLRSTPTGHSNSKGNLSITGFSSRSQSQPGSRSNSPKAAERMAWKRRKEYDPRKAVADAKAKVKEPGVTMRPKPSANSSIKRRMIRSASFTDSHKLSLSLRDSVSSSQELSSSERHEHEGLRRAFIPFHNSLRSERSHHSADEDESLLTATSTQNSTRSLMSLSVASKPKSAFTPPLIRTKAISPDDPSPRLTAFRRRTSGLSELEASLSALALQSNGDLNDSRVETPPQASYDSLIVSSIYQLSLKVKTTLDKSLNKLRDQNRLRNTPSPIDDFISDSNRSEIPAWKSANQELAGILKNLRKTERHVQIINAYLFPDDSPSKVSQQIQRIQHELAGFHPIDHPQTEENDIASPEMAELSGQF
ncbi:centrosomal protein of 170 kDa protein B-like isoform X2 [Physella acuta]|uniref:centrosomal protein of 170 kDa protein B-like isoform X2 n=1 Tax=Physella acuta TaxID=109671 RepID=UPI0027DD265B|nr:centrosomal protein of 170 kDa protein B-like isoform X2 [Physella acuta]